MIQLKLLSKQIYTTAFFLLKTIKFLLGLINREVSPAEMAFQARAEDFKIDTDVYVSGWFYEKHRVRTGYGETLLVQRR